MFYNPLFDLNRDGRIDACEFAFMESDVATERRIVKEVIHEWNTINSNNRGIVLLPLGWETYSVPSMDKTAQEIINEQV